MCAGFFQQYVETNQNTDAKQKRERVIELFKYNDIDEILSGDRLLRGKPYFDCLVATVPLQWEYIFLLSRPLTASSSKYHQLSNRFFTSVSTFVYIRILVTFVATHDAIVECYWRDGYQ